VTPQQAYDAFAELARTSPAWIGSRVDGRVITRACTRCGGTEEREVPPSDEELFVWLKAFADQHRACKETP
jgi:hypothetical protein